MDLQLSISLMRPREAAGGGGRGVRAEALRRESAEEMRKAAEEREYAERVREMTRREMEMAEREFARARHVWERAKADVERAERMKERAITPSSSPCMEITCQSCRQRFRP